jgi:ABC-type branched-subunit amino acid transport system ATPase component/branched-subunit amino acid ABC-type transport system permease component
MCVVAVAAALVIAAIAAIPTLRIGGFYLALVTLFLALAIPLMASHMTIAGKASGLSLATVPTFVQHPSGLKLYQVGIGILALLAGYSWIIKHCRLGRRFSSLMASEDLAQSIGITPYWTKLTSMMLAAVPCGIGGAFYVYSQQFISPGSVSPTLSIYILAGLVIGGGGTIIGPIIGTALVGAASQFLGGFNKYQGIVYGVALIFVAAGLPYGLVGLYQILMYRMRERRAGRAPEGVPLEVENLEVLNMALAGPTLEAEEPLTELEAFGVAPVERGVVERPVLGEGIHEHHHPDGDHEHAAPADGLFAGAAASRATGEKLTVKGVYRSFGGVRAIDGVDLTVEQGRIHALVGPNGSGKTTLLNLICGFYRLDDGEIWLGEKRLDRLRAAQVARLGIARTFQTPKLLIGDTAVGNVLVGADRCADGSLVGAVLHTRRARASDRVGQEQSVNALTAVGLAEDSIGMAAVMPHGTQRLLEIARAMALQPTFLLLDEPAAGLSVAEVESLKDAVRQVARHGLGVLLVEHNLPVVFGLADEVTVLHQGQVIAAGTPAEVSADPEVVRVYLGRQAAEHDVPTTTRGMA